MPKIKESYILEKSIVDPRSQTLKTEHRNLDWDGVLSVVENQVYAPSCPKTTDVNTVVRFESRFGRRSEVPEKRGWLGGWGAAGVQRGIELVGRSRMRDGLQRSREGMKIVLEQLRERGFVDVVKEQRQGQWERWKQVRSKEVQEEF